MPLDAAAPKVSIVLPTFNRAGFLRDALGAIRAQRCDDWELLIIDDGSTDDTRDVVEGLAGGMPGLVRYIHQTNRGAYGARNTGLNHARGTYVAFFDSDDLWLPHHLERCVAALDAHPELDWVYGSCKMVDHRTGAVGDDNNFYPGGKPRPFLQLATRRDGDLHMIDDTRVVDCQIRHGLYAGLQNSVIRAHLFRTARFDERYRVVEDVLFLIRALASGARIGYFPSPHVIYRSHDGNSSGSAQEASDAHVLAVVRELADGYERLSREMILTGSARRALRRRLSGEYFWHLGYHGLWRIGRRPEALAAFRKGLTLWPWDLRLWRTYLLAIARSYTGLSA